MTSSTHTRPVAQAPESAPPTRPQIHHLRAAGVSVVVDARGPRLPRIAHWGADLGDLDDGLLSDLVPSGTSFRPLTPGESTAL